MAEIDPIVLSRMEKIVQDNDDHDLQTLLKLLCAQRLKDLEDLMRNEIESVKNRQKRIRWLNNLVRAINGCTDDKTGKLEINDGSELKTLLDQGKDLIAEAEKMEKEAAEIAEKIKELESDFDRNKHEIGELERRREFLIEEASENRDTVKAVDMANGKKTFSKAERERLMENIRMAHDDLGALNQRQMQTMSRLNNERHETLLMAKLLAKNIHEDLVNKARAIAR